MLSRRKVLSMGAALAATPGSVIAGPTARRLAEELDRPLRIMVPEGAQANLAAVMRDFEVRCGCPAEMVVVDVDDINAALTLESILPEMEIDVALPATFGIPDLVEAQAILPLDDFASEHQPGDFESSQLYRTGDKFDGKLWGYQTDGDVFLMFYHRNMLTDLNEQKRYSDQFGKILDVPETWAELDRQMAFFHRPEQGRYGGCLFRTATYAAWEWWARFHANGGRPFDSEFTPSILSDAGVTALETMIVASDHLVGTKLGLFDNWARYNKGDIYANIGWGGTQKNLNIEGAGMRDRVTHGPLPGGLVNGKPLPISYFNWGWSYVVARNCQLPELAYLFCLNAVGREASTDAVAEADGYFDPFRTEHYEDPRIINAYGRGFLNEHRRALVEPIPDLYVFRRGAYFESLTQWILYALAGEVVPTEALKNISAAWELTTEQVGRNKQIDAWRQLHTFYPAAIRHNWES